MTHKELVEISYRWVLKNGGMTVAFKELYSLAREIPDVIGFNSWESMVVECKVSRSDFLKDQKKTHREKGMGVWRFYACPKGMIKKEELPEKWGLIYVENWKARVEYNCMANKWADQHPNKHEVDMMEERRLLFTVVRRLFIKGYVKHIYDKQYNKNSNMNDLILFNQGEGSQRSVASKAK